MGHDVKAVMKYTHSGNICNFSSNTILDFPIGILTKVVGSSGQRILTMEKRICIAEHYPEYYSAKLFLSFLLQEISIYILK